MKSVSIPKWLELHYASDDPARPAINTVRAWCRDGKLYPRPRKQGRSYFLDPRAVYVDPSSITSMREAKRIVHGSEAA